MSAKKHSSSVWKRIFFWLSGAGTETIEQGPTSPEKRQMLEAIKKGFYDDMHKRMALFFSNQSNPNEA